MTDPVELLDEIINDPLDLGYKFTTGTWRSVDHITHMLNARHQFRRSHMSAIDIYDSISIYDRAQLSPSEANDLQMILSLGDIAVYGNAWQTLMQLFWGTPTGDELTRRSTIESSRAEFLWGFGAYVEDADVVAAKAAATT